MAHLPQMAIEDNIVNLSTDSRAMSRQNPDLGYVFIGIPACPVSDDFLGQQVNSNHYTNIAGAPGVVLAACEPSQKARGVGGRSPPALQQRAYGIVRPQKSSRTSRIDEAAWANRRARIRMGFVFNACSDYLHVPRRQGRLHDSKPPQMVSRISVGATVSSSHCPGKLFAAL